MSCSPSQLEAFAPPDGWTPARAPADRVFFGRILIESPRWLLLLALVFAPWAYGSTREWAIEILNWLLGITGLLWLAGCAARRRWPQVPMAAAVVAGSLFILGWWMALNAHHYLDPQQGLLPRSALVSALPGSAEGSFSTATMFTVTGLLVALLFGAELSQRSQWRKRIWLTMALTGFSIALLGLAQKLGGDPVLALSWEPAKRDITNNFATFRYRANAGAWLNLILPMLAGLAFLSFQKRGQPWRKALWLVALFTVVAGIQLNPSRASWSIAVAIALALGGRILWRVWRQRHDSGGPRQLLWQGLGAALILAAMGAIVVLGGWETSWHRFSKQRVGQSLSLRSPTEIYRRILPDAGLTGYGPGTFQVIFPAYQATHDFGGRPFPECWVKQRWIHAHQDYLQTMIEWGYLGTALWAVLVLGGVARGVAQYFRCGDPRLRWFLLCSLLGIAGVHLHALMDFPLQIASIQLYVAVLLGICWGARNEEREERQFAGQGAQASA